MTYLLVGTVAGARTLLDRQQLVSSEVYRLAVRDFEEDMLATWFVEEPSVIGLDQWREYDAIAMDKDHQDPSPPA